MLNSTKTNMLSGAIIHDLILGKHDKKPTPLKTCTPLLPNYYVIQYHYINMVIKCVTVGKWHERLLSQNVNEPNKT